jgi:NAD(P)-dependent dehydrogenase (short-subunit alcohol dehydrogenase family)
MLQRLQGKVALVTGSTQGLGEGIAACCAREGARVAIHGRSVEKGDRVLATLRAQGAEVHFIAADLSRKEAAQALVREAAAHFGGLDILVNNAQAVPALIEAESSRNDDYLELALRSGLYASLWTSQAALPFMQRAGSGRIVNFASINGAYGSKYGIAYNSAKEAIRGLTRTLANEWGRFNITVNVVMPSGVSPSYEAFYRDDPAKAAAVARLNPMRRHGRAEEDIGKAVLGLVSDSGAYITGQSLYIDGGSNLLGLPQLHSGGTHFQ